MAKAPVYEIQGKQVKLPVEVRDASSGNAMYMVDAAAAQALLPGDAFKVEEPAPGQTQLLLGIIDYRDNPRVSSAYGRRTTRTRVRGREGAGAEACRLRSRHPWPCSQSVRRARRRARGHGEASPRATRCAAPRSKISV